MAYIKNLFDRNFLLYASYVIKDRAIPGLEALDAPRELQFDKEDNIITQFK